MAFWADIVGIIIGLGLFRWLERYIAATWADSKLRRSFSSPPLPTPLPFAPDSEAYQLLERVVNDADLTHERGIPRAGPELLEIQVEVYKCWIIPGIGADIELGAEE